MTDQDYDPEFKGVPMWDQLGKVLDSYTLKDLVDPARFNPVKTVVTDDGVTFEVNDEDANYIKDVLMMLKIEQRRNVIKAMQYSKGFKKVLDLSLQIRR